MSEEVKQELKALLEDRLTGLKDSSNTNKTYNSIFALFEEALEKRDGDWRLAIMHLSTEQRESVLETLSTLTTK